MHSLQHNGIVEKTVELENWSSLYVSSAYLECTSSLLLEARKVENDNCFFFKNIFLYLISNFWIDCFISTSKMFANILINGSQKSYVPCDPSMMDHPKTC